MNRTIKILGSLLLFIIIAVSTVFSFPKIAAWHAQQEEQRMLSSMLEQFPVTVDPKNKVIVENVGVNTFLDNENSPFQAAAINVENIFWSAFEWIAAVTTETPWYQSIAATNGRVIVIKPGMRKEQVGNTFAKTLGWKSSQIKEFTTATKSSSLPLFEGSFSPGTYIVDPGTTPSIAQALVNERFTDEILSHYGTSTEKIVPLNQALIIASLIQREAGGTDDMRIISGIIWNRLFADMRLQIDATIQYAKANTNVTTSWWPKIVPADIYRKSPYNTYKNNGLPPTPIANPSVAAVLAALNPKNTPCMFYFHDNLGRFYCTNTYEEHVALLKKLFGRGK